MLDTANETKAELNKVRRKSRELEDSPATWPRRRTRGTSSARAAHARLARPRGVQRRRAEAGLPDDRQERLHRAGELTSAIRAMDPNASDQVIIDMIKYADADKDGKVDEFKKIMLYKPEEDYKLSDQA